MNWLVIWLCNSYTAPPTMDSESHGFLVIYAGFGLMQPIKKEGQQQQPVLLMLK